MGPGVKESPNYPGPFSDCIQLLIVQPTPFCNIQCDYCYLPDRADTSRMSPETFRLLLERVFSSGLVPAELSLVWHAGEPLVLPPAYYESLMRAADDLLIPRTKFRQSIQTNAMLVNEAWCSYILGQDIHVGVSIDGPAWLHDAHRKDRQGRGTHRKVMEGIEMLKSRGIDLHIIAVITADALDHPDEIFDFFLNLGIVRVGFNVEELEGVHGASTLMRDGIEERVWRFWLRMYERQVEAGSAIQIREFVRAYKIIAGGPSQMTADWAMRQSSLVAPLGIVTVDWQGNFSTFSPELLGLKSIHYGDFTFGNIYRNALSDLQTTEKFNRVARDVYEGVKKCERECQYFELCGGGAPSNKYFENGSLVSTETMYCRTTVQMPIEIVLNDIEGHLGLAAAAEVTGSLR